LNLINNNGGESHQSYYTEKNQAKTENARRFLNKSFILTLHENQGRAVDCDRRKTTSQNRKIAWI
jgi:hypothetical protein